MLRRGEGEKDWDKKLRLKRADRTFKNKLQRGRGDRDRRERSQ